jgi:hypothetical protein
VGIDGRGKLEETQSDTVTTNQRGDRLQDCQGNNQLA